MTEQTRAALPAWVREAADRANKATKGPWAVKRSLVFGDAWDVVQNLAEDQEYKMLAECFPDENDANLCAAARTDVPKLIDMAAEMAAALKAAKVAMQERCQARQWQCEGKFCGPACAGQCEAQCVPGFTEVLAKWNGGANS